MTDATVKPVERLSAGYADLDLGEYPGTPTILALEKKPLPPVAPERVCAGCRHWQRSFWFTPDDPNAMGECMVFDYPTRLEIVGDNFGCRPEFNTPATHGCNEWQPRPATPDAEGGTP